MFYEFYHADNYSGLSKRAHYKNTQPLLNNKKCLLPLPRIHYEEYHFIEYTQNTCEITFHFYQGNIY